MMEMERKEQQMKQQNNQAHGQRDEGVSLFVTIKR